LLDAPDELDSPLAGVEAVVELVVSAVVLAVLAVGVSAAALLDDELDEELPQPASTTSAATHASVEITSVLRLRVACPAESRLTHPPLVGVVALTTPPGADPSRRFRPAASPRNRAYARRRPTVSAMQLDEAIRTRRTHKAFGPEPVPRETLDELFELARWAPNHHLTNPWRFRVLGAHTRARLMELAESTQAGSAVKLQRAPTLVAVSAKLGGDLAQDSEDRYATALAAYVVLLAAHARGLAGYWRTVPLLDHEHGRAILGLGADETPLGLLYLGTPVQEQRVPERAAPDEFVSYLD
jgi:nitroreductase